MNSYFAVVAAPRGNLHAYYLGALDPEDQGLLDDELFNVVRNNPRSILTVCCVHLRLSDDDLAILKDYTGEEQERYVTQGSCTMINEQLADEYGITTDSMGEFIDLLATRDRDTVITYELDNCEWGIAPDEKVSEPSPELLRAFLIFTQSAGRSE